MPRLFCACCGRPFQRTSMRGPAPLYCSDDCRRQMAVRRRAWTRADLVVLHQPHVEVAAAELGAAKLEANENRNRRRARRAA